MSDVNARHDARIRCGKTQVPNLKPQTPSPKHQGRAGHDRMVELVETMLKLRKDLPKAKTPHEAEALHRQKSATDRQMDMLVYELYRLTEEEIRIVEGEK
jgi:hypothetical protein